MRIKLYFGSATVPIQLDWDKAVTDFPHTIFYDGKGWEWFMYQPFGMILSLGYELYFSELRPHDPRYNLIHVPLADIISGMPSKDDCDCGGDKNKDSGGHWGFCKTRK